MKALPATARLALACLALAPLAAGCQSDVESRLEQARALQEGGDFAGSLGVLGAALQRDPDHPEANYRLGAALVQTGEPSRAVWPLQKASESPEYQISAGVLLASTHVRTGNYDEAIHAADRVLAVAPGRQAALRIRARARLAARRLEGALADSTELVARFPDDYGVRALHASVLGELGRHEEAEREHLALKELGEASGDPDFRDRACLAPGIFAQDVLGDAERARAHYEACAAHGPTDPMVLNHLSAFFDAIGETERATALWRGALEAAPERLALHQGLAARLEALGRSEEALGVLRESVERFDSAEAWRALASYHRARREPEPALEAIEQVARLAPESEADWTRFVQADLLIDLDRLERAQEVIASLEQETYAHLLRGRIALVGGDPGRALEHFERGILAWPGNASARFLAGLAARDLGDVERAMSELREAVRAGNAETDAALELARLHLARGESQQALTFANLALRGRNGALRPEPYTIAARALAQLGDVGRARASLARLEALGFGAAALRERVQLARTTEGAERAVEVAEESGADLADPEQRGALRAVVDAEVALGRNAEALGRLDRALAGAPEEAALLEMRGAVLAAAGRDDEARASYERALALEADRAYAHAGLAELLRREGDLEGALARLERAVALAPHESTYAYAIAQLLLAAGRDEEAEARLRSIVRRHPDAAGARNDLAWLLAERGEELDLALSLAEAAQRQQGASPQVLDTLGWVHFQRGDLDRAVEVLEHAVRAAPDAPAVRYRLGRALAGRGDTQRAREALEAALAAGPFPEADAARHELAQLAR